MKLLGTSWGPLLGIAAINTTFLVLAAWLLRRRVGYLGAIVGCAFFASLVWSAGSEVMVDLTPLQMDPAAFTLLLLAAWSVADGDAPALVVLAGVGNYLVLGQLKYSYSAPGLGLFALVAFGLHLRGIRRSEPDRWPAVRRQAATWFLCAVALTVVVWLPPLYQQVSSSSGNLSNLLRASTSSLAYPGLPARSPSLLGALSAVVAIVAVPPLWLRPTFLRPTYDGLGGGTPFVWATFCGAVVLGAYAAVAAAGRRRRDRTLLLGLLTALVASVLALVTTLRDPDPVGLRGPYLHFLWPLATFVWLLLALGVLRSWPGLRAWGAGRGLAACAIVAVVVLGCLSVPIADMGSGTPPWSISEAAALSPAVRAAVRGKGPVLIEGEAWVLRNSVLLDVLAADEEFEVTVPYDVLTFGAHRQYSRARPDARQRAPGDVQSQGAAGLPPDRAVAPTMSSPAWQFEANHPVYVYLGPIQAAKGSH